MKFLIDAQLPQRLAAQLRQAGLEAIHTLDLPGGNRTTDRVINELSHESRPLPRSEPLLGLLHRKVVTKPVVLHRHRLVGKEAGRASIFD